MQDKMNTMMLVCTLLVQFMSGPLYPNTHSVLFSAFLRSASLTSVRTWYFLNFDFAQFAFDKDNCSHSF